MRSILTLELCLPFDGIIVDTAGCVFSLVCVGEPALKQSSKFQGMFAQKAPEDEEILSTEKR